MADKTKILIDCDPGHDDAVAILFAARQLDLLAITTVHGNNTVENTTRNALSVLALAGLDVPVAQGLADPLAMARISVAAMHGKSGLDGATLPEPVRKPIAAHAIDVIIETASKHRGELVVALVGPQTNFAAALAREPKLAQWVREITIMGGSATLGNVTPAAEFNVYADPEAAAAVFACGAPIRMVGYNVTRLTGFDQGDIDRMKASGKRVAGTIADLMGFYLERQRRTFGLTVAPMHDVCAVVPYVAPDFIRYVETTVQVELAGTLTRGMTVCDMRTVRPGARSDVKVAGTPNARVALESQNRPLIDLVVDTLLTYS
ncbi:MAG: nucleoside hydrolase [Alphaproteobacteria bacterium]|nr:nucleoside hydrolase [Alphaproteobacteria bacterium]